MQRLIETLKEDENEKEFVESLEKATNWSKQSYMQNTGNVQQMVEATYHYEKIYWIDWFLVKDKEFQSLNNKTCRVAPLYEEHQIQRYSILTCQRISLANYYENIFRNDF